MHENPGVIVNQVESRGIGILRIGILQMQVIGDIEKTRIEIFRRHVDVRQVQSAAQGDFSRKFGQTARYIVDIPHRSRTSHSRISFSVKQKYTFAHDTFLYVSLRMILFRIQPTKILED